ncbi:hypothetical protein EDB81DRAFT_277180 [Dactylonectria macrodidyma]|uniref:Uncharacterized protein n=1 Tax=Dactylonectria macrodidyma TaxID=307937 RepID=A0A9P9JN38_9HYPO|nr:hypothetical protein EDB81DRAFT_277180 [Dactylonectria macrodidyma]
MPATRLLAAGPVFARLTAARCPATPSESQIAHPPPPPLNPGGVRKVTKVPLRSLSLVPVHRSRRSFRPCRSPRNLEGTYYVPIQRSLQVHPGPTTGPDSKFMPKSCTRRFARSSHLDSTRLDPQTQALRITNWRFSLVSPPSFSPPFP